MIILINKLSRWVNRALIGESNQIYSIALFTILMIGPEVSNKHCIGRKYEEGLVPPLGTLKSNRIRKGAVSVGNSFAI